MHHLLLSFPTPTKGLGLAAKEKGLSRADQDQDEASLFPRRPPTPTYNTSPLSLQGPPSNGQRLPGLKAPLTSCEPRSCCL